MSKDKLSANNSFKVSPLLRCALIFSLSLLLTSCSYFGSKGKDGSGTLSEADLNAARDKRFGEGNIPSAEGENIFRDIFFAYDSVTLDDQARQDIEYNFEIVKANPDVKIVLEGHCDERGTAEYNMALGEQRARAVAEMLHSYGIATTRTNTISYGEEIPLDPGHDETAWAKNRRVHFSAFR